MTVKLNEILLFSEILSDEANWMSTGRLQSRGPAVANEQSPTAIGRERQMTRSLEADDQSRPLRRRSVTSYISCFNWPLCTFTNYNYTNFVQMQSNTKSYLRQFNIIVCLLDNSQSHPISGQFMNAVNSSIILMALSPTSLRTLDLRQNKSGC